MPAKRVSHKTESDAAVQDAASDQKETKRRGAKKKSAEETSLKDKETAAPTAETVTKKKTVRKTAGRKKEVQKQEAPAQETPAKEAAAKEEPVREVKAETVRQETAAETSVKETEKKAVEEKAAVKETAEKETVKEAAAREEPVKAAAEAAAREEPVKAAAEAAAKEEPAKEETAKQEPAAGEPAQKEAAQASAAEKPARKRTTSRKSTAAPKKTTTRKKKAAEAVSVEEPAGAPKEKAAQTQKAEPETAAAEVQLKAEEDQSEVSTDNSAQATQAQGGQSAPADHLPQPRRSIAFIGSECYPFVKTGGLGDVMYALPKALIAQNCDVKVILPRYKCIPQKWQEKMVYKGAFNMDLCSDGRSFYVGIMEYVWDGVVYDFIDNEDFFSYGNPYTNLVDDIPRFCYFGKAALAALNYMDWIPDIIHCHDWQAGLVPVFLREMFNQTPLARSKVILTIHNLRFQGVYNIQTIKYWTNLPDYVFNKDALSQEWTDANMLKGGMTYANMITTVSSTYAHEIQTPEYGENLDAHLRYHSGKLRGIVNGIDYELWDPSKDQLLAQTYDSSDVIEKKKLNKLALQEELGLEKDENKFVIGLISRLTNQKGLDLVNAVVPQLLDGNTQIVILGTGDPQYEDSFRYYENTNKGTFCANIMYDESRAHRIYAGADALLVPSRFEPCGLTQLIAMHYGTIPIVRETGGLKDTVTPYNKYINDGNGFTFDRYESGLLLDAINRAKTLYFTERDRWDDMIERDMAKDVSWNVSARAYRHLYLELVP